MKSTTFRADTLLLLAAAIWGSGFVAQRLGMKHVGPLTFTGVRFLLGALLLCPIIWLRKPANAPNATTPNPGQLRTCLMGGCIAGTILFAGALLQQIGIITTTAGKAGFITGLYVVLVPILGLLVRQRTHANTWIGAALAAVGLYLLSVTGSFEVNPGDVYIMCCAIVWAVHVLVIGRLSPRTDPLKLAATQFAVAGVLGTAAALLAEQVTTADLMAAKWAIAYSGILSVGVAFTLQVVAQRHAPPAHAAILLSLEAVFAAIAGGLILGEAFETRELAGCGLMLAGMLASQLRRSDQAESTEQSAQ